MKENKGKGIAGDESVQPGTKALAQTHPSSLSTLKLVLLVSSEKRKTMSKKLDTGNLPSCRGNKKQKVDSSTSSITPVMLLDLANLAANPTISKVEDSLPHLGANPSKPSPTGPLNSGLITLLRSKGLAWDRFKQAMIDKDIAIFYDISVKEFEWSIVHNLFKVF